MDGRSTLPTPSPDVDGGTAAQVPADDGILEILEPGRGGESHEVKQNQCLGEGPARGAGEKKQKKKMLNNDERSLNVYENKGTQDAMPEK